MERVYELTAAETKLAELLWQNSPIPSMEMVRLGEKEFGWKKSTTFSVLKVLIKKGVAKNENATVSMLCSREQFVSMRSRRYVEDTFGGSLPKFITAFFGGKKLSPELTEELIRLIKEHGSENDG